MAGTNELQYLKEMASLDYPFVGPNVPAAMRSMIADLRIQRSQQSTDYPLNPAGDGGLKLTQFDANGAGGFDITFSDEDDNPVIQSETASDLVTRTWSTWTLYEWRHPDWVMQIVFPTASLAVTTTLVDPLRVTARAVEHTPKLVKSIRVNGVVVDEKGKVTNPTASLHTFTDSVKIVAGYNIQLQTNATPTIAAIVDEAATATSPEPDSLQIGVVPGAGQGRYPGCDEATEQKYIRSLNGITPDEKGNINIDATECYRIERPITFNNEGVPPDENPRRGNVTLGTLLITGDCKSCSDCEDYFNAYQLLRRVYLRLKGLQNRVGVLINRYTDLTRLITTLNSYLGRPEVRFRVVQNQSNVFTFQVMFRTGSATFGDFIFRMPWPATPTNILYRRMNFTGWQRLDGQQAEQKDDMFKIGPNDAEEPGNWMFWWKANRTFAPNTVSFWWWTITILPNEDVLESPPTSESPVTGTTRFTAQPTATVVENPGGANIDLVFQNFDRVVSFRYPPAPTTSPILDSEGSSSSS